MPADSFTTTLGVLLMGTGNDNNSWGTNQNSSVFQIFEDAIVNVLSTAASAGQLGASNTLDLSGSPPPAAASQARYAVLVFTGVITANQTVKVPNLTKTWLVQNNTSGAFSVSIKTPSGSAVAVPQGTGYQAVLCDGSNNIVVFPFNTNQVQMPDGTLAAPAYSNVNETGSGWRRAGTQDWRFVINGADVLQLTGAGASSPSIINIASTQTLEYGGGAAGLVPVGAEMPFAGINAPTGWFLEYGQTVSRTTYANLFGVLAPNAIGGTTITGNTHTSTTIDNLSVDLRNLGLEGATIEGTGVQSGTTIVSIGSATSMTISQATTSSVNGITVRCFPYGNGDGSTTFALPDRRGRVVAGRDNMGGTAASRLTLAETQGILGTKLSATGGEEGHTITVAESAAITPTGTIGGSQNLGNVLTGTVNNAQGGTGTLAVSTQSNITVNGSNFTFTGNSQGGGGAHNNVQPTGISNFIIKY